MVDGQDDRSKVAESGNEGTMRKERQQNEALDENLRCIYFKVAPNC